MCVLSIFWFLDEVYVLGGFYILDEAHPFDVDCVLGEDYIWDENYIVGGAGVFCVLCESHVVGRLLYFLVG
jgi:hypothetical protein